MSPAAPIRHAAEKATLELPFSIPAKDWFSLREAAQICGMGERFMEELFDRSAEKGSGEIFGHRHNAGAGARMTKRIPRIFLIAYLVRTATYTDQALLDCLIGSWRHLPRESLLRLAAAARKFAEDKPLSPAAPKPPAGSLVTSRAHAAGEHSQS
jgi:hypothetical protein